MAYDLEEQESLSEIKAWWEKWGTLILTIVTVACLAAAGMRGWQWYQMKQSADAGSLYSLMTQANNNKDQQRVQNIALKLQEDYAGTAFAGMGALLAAYTAEQHNKASEAIKDLQWVIDSKDYPELQTVAAVRLAGIYIDQGSFEQALNLLNSIKNPDAEKALVEDRKGDAYIAMGNKEKAKECWTEALRACTTTNPLAKIIEIKLQAL